MTPAERFALLREEIAAFLRLRAEVEQEIARRELECAALLEAEKDAS